MPDTKAEVINDSQICVMTAEFLKFIYFVRTLKNWKVRFNCNLNILI